MAGLIPRQKKGMVQDMICLQGWAINQDKVDMQGGDQFVIAVKVTLSNNVTLKKQLQNHFGSTLTCNMENGVCTTATACLVRLALHCVTW